MIDNLVRPCIKKLKPYSSARDEFKGSNAIFLDANENPFGEFNRYPDPHQVLIKQQIAKINNVEPQNIFLGNGSDEAIDLVFRIFCEPAKHKALQFPPTYGMYSVCAGINDVEMIEVDLTKKFQLNIKAIVPLLQDEHLKLIFICSPNNPTANNINAKDIHFILKNFKGIVVIDEAYIDFSEQESFVRFINTYPNLIVLKTFSKAWGLAAARVGMAFSNKEIISYFNKIKPPYNISLPNQQIVLNALTKKQKLKQVIKTIQAQKLVVQEALLKLRFVQKIYPSDANFILVKVTNATAIYDQLLQKNIVIRNRTSVMHNCLRITIGTPNENKQLINALIQLNHD